MTHLKILPMGSLHYDSLLQTNLHCHPTRISYAAGMARKSSEETPGSRGLHDVIGLVLLASSILIFASLATYDRLDLTVNTTQPNVPPQQLKQTPRNQRKIVKVDSLTHRYFPDLTSLLQEALVAVWPGPEQALAPVAASADPAERIAFATRYLLRHVHDHQGAVRAMISTTITEPARSGARPGMRFALIDHALAPFEDPSPGALARLKNSLALACGAEAFFVLTDLCGLTPDDAIATAVETAATLTRAAFAAET